MSISMRITIHICGILLMCASQVQASSVEYRAKWSGVSYLNQATAIALMTIDTEVWPNPANFMSSSTSAAGITKLNMTVSGASSGNGIFNLADFGTTYWGTNGATLDMSRELVGQSTSGQTFGSTSGSGGEFNFFPAANGNPATPSGSWYFTLTTNGGNGDSMVLTSFAPVPEPTSCALAAVATLALLTRRRRSTNG